jgi:hypothetical protein
MERNHDFPDGAVDLGPDADPRRAPIAACCRNRVGPTGSNLRRGREAPIGGDCHSATQLVPVRSEAPRTTEYGAITFLHVGRVTRYRVRLR